MLVPCPPRVGGETSPPLRREAASGRPDTAEPSSSPDARYRALFDAAPVALFVCDRDAVIQDYNRWAVELWGREPQRGVERHCGSLRLFRPDGSELPHDQTPMKDVLRSGVAVRNVEVVIERPDGKRIPVMVSFAPLREVDGAIGGAATSFYDISERKEAERRLRESDARYQTLFNSIDEGFCVVEVRFDPAGAPVDYRFVDLNPAFEAQSGLRNALGQWMRELAPQHEEHWFQIYGRVAVTGEPNRFEAHAQALGRWFDVYAFRIGAADARRVAILFKDISARKQAELKLQAVTDDLMQSEEALRESETFLQSVIGASPDCIKVLDLEGRLKWMSENGLCAMEIPDFNRVRDADWFSFWHDPATRDLARAALQTALAGQLGRFRGFCPTRAGQPKWWDVVVSSIRSADGAPRAVLGVSRDITERKRAEEELERTLNELESRVFARTAELAEANENLRAEIRARAKTEEARQQLLGRLVGAEESERRRISRELHDQVGQEITALMLGLKALHPRLPASDHPALRQLEEIAESISVEVHDLALDLRPTALDDAGLASALASYVDNWSARTRVLAEFHQASLESGLPASLETTVYRLVQEALANVAKHAHGQRVSVVVERRPDHVLVIVEDDGVGFDVEQTLNARSPKRLGLLGMIERASAWGGTVNIESFPARGTAVYCRLPVSNPEVPHA